MKTVTFDSSITINSPIGNITLKSLGEAVVQVSLHGFENPTPETLASLPNSKQPSPSANHPAHSEASPVLVKASKQISDFFAGKNKVLDFAVEPAGTDFQLAVWREIGKIGFGEVASYADIASRIGKPSAVRAVGGAVGANPVPLVIGCHRVLGASSNITGYSGGDGLPTKRWLLGFEGIGYRDVPEARRDAETLIKLE